MDRDILDQIRANNIPDRGIEEKREKRPTREDVRRLLSEEEGKIFFLQITFNAKRGKTLDYKDIYEHLYERYRLYKLRSSITDGKSESHTLSPSTYIAYINQNQAVGIALIQAIVSQAKESLYEMQRTKIAQVHVIASMALVYDD